MSARELYGKVLADREYVKRALFEELSDWGIHLVHGLKANMGNGQYISEHLRNKADLVHLRHLGRCVVS